MIRYNLRTKIALNLVIFLVLGMVLLAFVVVASAQGILARAEMAKGNLLLSAMQMVLVSDETQRGQVRFTLHQDKFDRLVKDSGLDCALIMDTDQNIIYKGGDHCQFFNEMVAYSSQTLTTGAQQASFVGTAFGVIWKPHSALIIAKPFFRSGKIVAATAVTLNLDTVKTELSSTYRILIIYIFINTVALTLVGLRRISSLIVRPVNKLLKRADEYKELTQDFFLDDTEDNEFNQLSRALNRMLNRIAEDRQALETTVASLEKANADLKRAHREIIRAEKLASVGRLSAGIAHEIGNPIGIILGYLELLRDPDLSEQDRLDFLQRASDEVNRINVIIRQLLDFSRPSKASPERVSVHGVIRDLVETLKFQPIMSQIQIDLALTAETDAVLIHEDQLRQVCLNLILNSADAIGASGSGEKGEIRISTEMIHEMRSADSKLPAPMLKLCIQDNGPGIAAEHMDMIFDPFFTTKAPGKGTGLGLSVSFMIIEAAGGTLEVSSEPGQGTMMEILLPICEDLSCERVEESKCQMK